MGDEFKGFCLVSILFLFAMMFAIILVAAHEDAALQNKIDELKRNQCAWIFHEDGSVSPRTDDYSRFKCMTENE